jgi:hypothetical protein
MITIRKQKRGHWEDYLPKARALHKESVERFSNRLAQMARKENPAARPVLSRSQCERVCVVLNSNSDSERKSLAESYRSGQLWMRNFLARRNRN